MKTDRFLRRVPRVVVCALLLSGCAGPSPDTPTAGPDGTRAVNAQRTALRIDNPYADVNWAQAARVKANLHTHTTVSDGRIPPHDAVDRYHALGYGVLAITDHNAVVYPWQAFPSFAKGDQAYEPRDPEALGMLAIQGNELSSHDHMGSYYTDHNGTARIEASLAAIREGGGLAILNHPGRYNRPLSQLADLFREHPFLLGLEIYNQGDRYPADRGRWDALLTELLPDRTVHAFSNDDMHKPDPQLGRNWNVFLLPEPTHEAFRDALEAGRFLYVYAPAGHEGTAVPHVRAITVRRGKIRIDADGAARIVWLSEGREVHTGTELNTAAVDGLSRYVRAELHGPGENAPVVGTQAFVLTSPDQKPRAAR